MILIALLLAVPLQGEGEDCADLEIVGVGPQETYFAYSVTWTCERGFESDKRCDGYPTNHGKAVWWKSNYIVSLAGGKPFVEEFVELHRTKCSRATDTQRARRRFDEALAAKSIVREPKGVLLFQNTAEDDLTWEVQEYVFESELEFGLWGFLDMPADFDPEPVVFMIGHPSPTGKKIAVAATIQPEVEGCIQAIRFEPQRQIRAVKPLRGNSCIKHTDYFNPLLATGWLSPSGKRLLLWPLMVSVKAAPNTLGRPILLNPQGELARLHNAYGYSRHQEKDYPASEKAFSRAIELDPEFHLALFNLACAQARNGHDDAAMASLERLLAINKRFRKKVKKDKDLNSLRTRDDFGALLR